MRGDPMQIAADRRRRRDNKKFIIRKPCDGHVRLYVASLIKELRIDNFTDRHRHIIRRNALQHSFGVTSHQLDFAKTGHIKKTN